MKSAADIWICRYCRSINSLSSGRCYKCNTPREVAASKPEDLTIAHQPITPEATGVFRRSEPLAVAVTIASVAFIGATLVALLINWSIADARAAGDPAQARAFLPFRLPALIVASGVGLVALLSYAAWIRRVVENLPALGLGYAKVSPTWAFVEPLLPGVNLYAFAARISEVVAKLGGHNSAIPLLGLALLTAIVPPVVLAVLLRFTGFFLIDSDYFPSALAMGLLVVFVLQALALLIGLYVLWQVEGLQRAKAASALPGATATTA